MAIVDDYAAIARRMAEIAAEERGAILSADAAETGEMLIDMIFTPWEAKDGQTDEAVCNDLLVGQMSLPWACGAAQYVLMPMGDDDGTPCDADAPGADECDDDPAGAIGDGDTLFM